MNCSKRERVILITFVIVLVVLNIVGYVKHQIWQRQYTMLIEELAVKIPVNKATINDFESLPGIGPALARRIVEHRQEHGAFTSLDGIKQVRGIGEKKFARILPYIILE